MERSDLRGAAIVTTFDRTKTLTQLEGDDWGSPNYDSHLVTTVHRLRHQPLTAFGIEDLRITILQNIGLKYLVPLAIERLLDDPLSQGDYYPGDLLNAVLRTDHSYWGLYPDQRKEICNIAECAMRQLDQTKEDVSVERGALAEGLSVFCKE
jgi:hypothetical protein